MYRYIRILLNIFSISVVTIGFTGTYSVHEDAASITVTVLVMNSLTRDVSVTLSTSDGTAMGGAFEHKMIRQA